MNFRLTPGKIIGMILVPVAIWILVFIYAYVTTRNLAYVPFPLIVSFFDMHDLENLFSMGNIFIFLVEAGIVFIILILLQGRKVKVLPQNNVSKTLPAVQVASS